MKNTTLNLLATVLFAGGLCGYAKAELITPTNVIVSSTLSVFGGGFLIDNSGLSAPDLTGLHAANSSASPNAWVSNASAPLAHTVTMSSGGIIRVTSSHMSIEVLEAKAWTIRIIDCQGEGVVGEFGSNGSVMMDQAGIWCGTGHGNETVSAYEVVVDGVSHGYTPGTVLTGSNVVLHKQSTMGYLGTGYLEHEAWITLPPSGDRVIEKHDYVVLAGFDANFKYLYAFMHMNYNDYNLWLAQLGGDRELEGQAGYQNNAFSLEQDVKAVTFYSTTRGRGVSYVYPVIYTGDDSSGAAAIKNSIWDRRDDNKLYFNPDVTGMNLSTGDRFSFHLEVIPFVATPAEWRDIGRGHAF